MKTDRFVCWCYTTGNKIILSTSCH